MAHNLCQILFTKRDFHHLTRYSLEYNGSLKLPFCGIGLYPDNITCLVSMTHKKVFLSLNLLQKTKFYPNPKQK